MWRKDVKAASQPRTGKAHGSCDALRRTRLTVRGSSKCQGPGSEEQPAPLRFKSTIHHPSSSIRRRRSVSGTLDETRFVIRDDLDRVAVITAAGVVDERYGYDAYCPVRVMDANLATRSSSTWAWNWLHHGEFLDTESGMYDYGYRFYHPALGRWASRDPIGERGGSNLNGFVGNDGVNNSDVRGLAVVSIEPVRDAIEKTLKKIDTNKPPTNKKLVNDIVGEIPKELIEKLKKIDCDCIEEPARTFLRVLGMCDGFSGEVPPFTKITGVVVPDWSVDDGVDPKLKIVGEIQDLPLLPETKVSVEVNIDSEGEAKGKVNVKIPVTNEEKPWTIGGSLNLPGGSGGVSISKEFPYGSLGIEGGVRGPDNEEKWFKIGLRWEF